MDLFKIILVIVVMCVSAVANTFESITTVESAGKGFATTASFEGVESLSKNPAGIIGSYSPTVYSNYTSYFGLYQAASFGYSMGLSEGRQFSIQLPMLTVDDIPKTIDQHGEAVQVGSFSDRQMGVSIGMATPVYKNKLFVGTSLHYLTHVIDDQEASSMTVDFGTIYKHSWFQLGASITNITIKEFQWETDSNESLPLTISAGAVVRLNYTTWYADMSVYDKTTQVNLGGEWNVTERLDVYAGLFDGTNTKQLTLGTTLHLERLDVLYASLPYEELGLVHKLGVAIQL